MHVWFANLNPFLYKKEYLTTLLEKKHFPYQFFSTFHGCSKIVFEVAVVKSEHFSPRFFNRLSMSISTLVLLKIILDNFTYCLKNVKNVSILRRFSIKSPDVSSIGACRPRIFFINGFICFFEDE